MSKQSAHQVICLRGVRQNNLKNLDLDLPLNHLIVITGLSGSGKSSLAFDTLFAEGQRRYIETFSPYARQFFDRMDKPQADLIQGIPPAIAIEQRNAVKTTRSTVGTMTEICDYMKTLWPHIAQLYCRSCGRPVRKDSPQQIWETLNQSGGRNPKPEALVTFDLPLAEKLSLEESLGLITKQGYQRLLLPAARKGAPPSQALALELNEAKAPWGKQKDAEHSAARAIGPRGERAEARGTRLEFPSWEGSGVGSRVGSQTAGDFETVRIDEAIERLKKLRPTSLSVVQDRVKLAPENRARFVEACEQAYHFGKGKLTVHFVGGDSASASPSSPGSAIRFSDRLHCAQCDLEYRAPSHALFSFNHPLGACPTCRGFGRTISIDYNLALPDRTRTLAEGVVKPWLSGHGVECQEDLMKFCKIRQAPIDVPFERLPKKWQEWVIQGDPGYGKDADHEWPRAWYGVRGYFRWLESKAYKMHVRVLLSRYRAYTPCPDCQGKRFQPEALLYQLPMDDLRCTRPGVDEGPETGGDASIANRKSKMTLADFYQLPVRDALRLIEQIARRHQPKPSDPIGLVLDEVRSRLGYLVEVGLGYLTLDRATRTLSGGETERVNLTTCLGTRLVNTLYVLDEPSVGLHPRDTGRLIKILEKLRDLGNTVVVVEHEASVIRAANRIVDLGPGHGESGGQIVFQGAYDEILQSEDSLTGQYLSGRAQIEIPQRRRVNVGQASRLSGTSQPTPDPQDVTSPANGSAAPGGRGARPALTLSRAALHNLKNITVEIPLGRFVCVTGVSGSGKTTLVREVLLPALEAQLRSRIADLKSVVKASDRFEDENENEDEDENDPSTSNQRPATYISGWEPLGRAVLVDQSPLGKTPRSNPAVYIGAFDDIRELFAQTDAAKQRGLNASAFSFNSTQGQCERCRGAGFEKIEMQFLSDVFIRCPDCGGRRYRPHILEVKVSRPLSVVSRQKAHRRKTTDNASQTTDQSWSIADLLDATVDEVIEFLLAFADSRSAPRAVEKLKLLQEVGLGYLRLGQPINTLSGGESQRLKLVSHLAESGAGVSPARFPTGNSIRLLSAGATAKAAEDGRDACPTLFLFDEPTTGLHFDDIRVLLKAFQRLVDAGHSVLVIEHNLDVIKCADWIIDLGPEAGDEGGQIVAEGTPEDIAACPSSHTGRFLRELFSKPSPRPGRQVEQEPSIESQPVSQ
jgi:excinuclease ABC subunit A